MAMSSILLAHLWLCVPARADPQEPAPASAREDGVLFLVAFSGGGTRAAAFGFGAAQALSESDAGGVPLIDRIDRVSGVSGGSFVAAQLAADSSSDGLAQFRKKFLLADMEAELLKSAAGNGMKLVSSDYNRSDAAGGFPSPGTSTIRAWSLRATPSRYNSGGSMASR